MTVAELSRRLGVDRGTTSRLLMTLGGAGYAVRVDDGRYFEISAPKIVSLYGLVVGRIELTQLARPILIDLRDQTNETANLAVLVDGEMIIIDMERSHAIVSASIGLGRRVPVHCTAVGKALVAHLPGQQLAEILEQKGQIAYTHRTITTADGLRAHLEKVRHLGYAVDDEENQYDARCVAAPVRSHTGRVIASLGLTGPSSRVTLQRADEFGGLVIKAARRLSADLGWESRHDQHATALAPGQDEGSSLGQPPAQNAKTG